MTMGDAITPDDTRIETVPDGIEALYLHIPFCRSRCRYCAFETSARDADDPIMDTYTEKMGSILRRASKAGLLTGVKTIYLGGGTPSYLGRRRLGNLLYLISLYIDLSSVTEFSMEANPDSFDERMLRDVWALGVDRYSIGAQSFDDEVLRGLGRAHDAKSIRETLDVLCERGANTSIDLMCGVPGQDMASWMATLQTAMEYDVSHMSVYPLTIEEGTPFSKAVESGAMKLPDDDLQADMMLMARDALEEHGIQRYEVANYAQPGFESRHNLAYWTDRPYLGIGSSAASMTSPTTFGRLVEEGVLEEAGAGYNHGDAMPDDKPALVRFACGRSPEEFASSQTMEVETERLDDRAALCERCMLELRLARGIDTETVVRRVEACPPLADAFDELIGEGLLEEKVIGGRNRLCCSDRGWLLGNLVFSRVWSCAARSATCDGRGT